MRFLISTILCAGFVFLSILSSSATAQKPEEITFEDTLYDLYTTPLENFFPDAKARALVFSNRIPNSTACHRGYVGRWKILSGELYLVSVLKGFPDGEGMPLSQINPAWNSPVKADWFTGDLRLGAGKVLTGGIAFDATREKEVLIKIKDGKVLSVEKREP